MQINRIVIFTSNLVKQMYQPKKQSEEAVKVWKEQQQILRMHLEHMVKNNSLAKLSVIAEEIGMSHDEFACKISINPRTPLQNAERIAIEHEILKRDREVYIDYLRAFHLLDSLTVE